MFNDSDSFFYSPTGDLTNTLQRQFSGKYNTDDPLWTRVRNYSSIKKKGKKHLFDLYQAHDSLMPLSCTFFPV